MKIFNVVRKSTYHDSVSLMLISRQLKSISGVEDAAVMMGTPANREILDQAMLLAPAGREAGPNDLIMAFRAADDTDVQEVCGKIEAQMARQLPVPTGGAAGAARSSRQAYRENPLSNLAVISVPGDYASAEALRALHNGKNVFLFSDNVPLEDEIALKRFAAARGLLVMGPDCGTAIIDGKGIGFANKVRPGDVGLIAASGTGLQEVTCLLDAMGLGVSQAIGTGGRDLKEEVGAITMLRALDLLLADAATRTIVLISKPPARPVAETVIARLAGSPKPAVLCFIGYEGPAPHGVAVASTLEEAAVRTAELHGIRSVPATPGARLEEWARQAVSGFSPAQKVVRALYAGGTLCYEAMLILSAVLGPVHSNIPLSKDLALSGLVAPGRHSAVDLGDDDYTRGRPHPMIDGTLRNEYILKVAQDPEMAVLLLDVVLGYGAGADPAGELVPAIREAKSAARAMGNELAVVAYVCGTDADEQNKSVQIAQLEAAGVLVARTNAEAARLAGKIAKGRGAG